MRLAERTLQLADALALLLVGPRGGGAPPPKRRHRPLLGFVLPAVVERGCDLMVAAGLDHIPALETFHDDGKLLFRGPLHLRLPGHARLLAEALNHNLYSCPVLAGCTTHQSVLLLLVPVLVQLRW